MNLMSATLVTYFRDAVSQMWPRVQIEAAIPPSVMIAEMISIVALAFVLDGALALADGAGF